MRYLHYKHPFIFQGILPFILQASSPSQNMQNYSTKKTTTVLEKAQTFEAGFEDWPWALTLTPYEVLTQFVF